MVVKHIKSVLGVIFAPSNKPEVSPRVEAWLKYLKTYKKTGIRLKQAAFVSTEGETISKYGEYSTITDGDIQTITKILQNGCSEEVLHLEKLYYCVKVATESLLVLFNGANYVIACLSVEQLLIVHVKARKPDGARATTWIQEVAQKLQKKAVL